MPGFDPAWLALRRPFDDAALDRESVARLRAWAGALPIDRLPRVVDLGSGTGVALRRVARWLPGRRLELFAVESDPAILAAAPAAWQRELGVLVQPGSGRGTGLVWPYQARIGAGLVQVRPVLGDALAPLGERGGPLDGTVDLVLGHALADVLPLDHLAQRLAALLRPGGLAHLALTYDGQTRFSPRGDPDLDRRIMAAYHRHMDRRRAVEPGYGGTTAGRRLPAALCAVGLEPWRVAPSCWRVPRGSVPGGAALLDWMIRFVVDSLRELGDPPEELIQRWERQRRAQLARGQLRLRVRHVDLLAGRPG